MSFFGVTKEKIEKVWDHPDADRLSIAKCVGMSFQFVIPKDQFKAGDDVVYLPVDSLLPEWLCSELGLTGKLAGTDFNRIKTIKLRKALSQGIVASLSILKFDHENLNSQELTEKLGIKKYEHPVQEIPNALLKSLPNGQTPYDIEGADRNQHIIDEHMMDEEVVIHEKMEGTNFSITKDDGKLYVNQKSCTIEELNGVENTYWKIARKSGLLDFIMNHPFERITLFAELCGPGIDNMYKIIEQKLYVFDIQKDFNFLSYDEFSSIIKTIPSNNYFQEAPLLFRGKLRDYLGSDTIQVKSNGMSVVNPKVKREGIVGKLVVEKYVFGFGRVIIKQRSPEYLSGSNN